MPLPGGLVNSRIAKNLGQGVEAFAQAAAEVGHVATAIAGIHALSVGDLGEEQAIGEHGADERIAGVAEPSCAFADHG